MVSVLPFVRKLMLDPWAPAPGTSGAWGIDVTVSVSTVMLCNDVSPVLVLVMPCFIHVLDCFEVNGGGALADPFRAPGLVM